MRVLSLSRPWPWTIFDLPEPDAKGIENRSWPPPIEAIGERIALHAAKSWDDAAISFLLRMGIEHMPARYDQHPHGVIVGVATIDFVVTATSTLHGRGLGHQARWFFETRADGKDNFGWVLADKRKLGDPVPWVGRQGLRHLPADVEAAINRQIGA